MYFNQKSQFKQKVVVIYYESGNTWSVLNAPKYIGTDCELSNNKNKISQLIQLYNSKIN